LKKLFSSFFNQIIMDSITPFDLFNGFEKSFCILFRT
jgi:hypothetical protein